MLRKTLVRRLRVYFNGEVEQRLAFDYCPMESRTLPRTPPNRGELVSPYQMKKIPNWIESSEGYNSDTACTKDLPDIVLVAEENERRPRHVGRSNSFSESKQGSPTKSTNVHSTMTLTRTPRRKRNKWDAPSEKFLATRRSAVPNIAEEFVRMPRRDAVPDISEAYSKLGGKDFLKMQLDENYNDTSRKGMTIGRHKHSTNSDDEFFVPRSNTFSSISTVKKPNRHNKSKSEIDEHSKSEFTLEEMLKNKSALQAFREFLKSEYSEENLDFWMDCEYYKTLKGSKQEKMATRIFTHYLSASAPREVNIDSEIRKATEERVKSPDNDTFTEAQNTIYTLMKSDPFRRFLTSEKYLKIDFKKSTLKKK